MAVINKKGCEILGYEESEIIGKRWIDNFIPEGDRNKTRAGFFELITGDIEPVEYFENYVLTIDNKEKLIAWHNSILRDDGGKIIATLSSGEDITERKRADEALRESEERFRLAFENANDGVYLVDTEGNLVRVNNRMCDIFGYSKKDLESMTVNDIAHPEDKGISLKFMEKSISGEVKSTVFEKRYFHKQGHIIWGQVSSSIIKDARGDPSYFISHVRDITQRKQAEAALETRLNYVKMLSQISTEAISVIDIDEFLDNSLKTMGNTLDVSRIYIFKHHHETDTMENTFEWVASGMQLQIDTLKNLPASIFPWRIEMMHNNQIINYKDIEDIPGEQEKDILREQGIKSILVVPLFIRGKYHGFIGFDECRYYRDWITEDIQILKTVAQVIVQAIGNKQTTEILKVKTDSLEESNIALKVLLERRNKDKTELEEKVLYNVKELVLPYLEKIKNSGLRDMQSTYADILESNLNDIISPFSHTLTAKYSSLTPREIQVANLIKQGKTNKEISGLLILSIDTIAFHRKNIRRKLGLQNTKSNLRSHLMSLS